MLDIQEVPLQGFLQCSRRVCRGDFLAAMRFVGSTLSPSARDFGVSTIERLDRRQAPAFMPGGGQVDLNGEKAVAGASRPLMRFLAYLKGNNAMLPGVTFGICWVT